LDVRHEAMTNILFCYDKLSHLLCNGIVLEMYLNVQVTISVQNTNISIMLLLVYVCKNHVYRIKIYTNI